MGTELKEAGTKSVPSRARFFRHPFIQLILARVREFYREPEAVFWVYGFPLLMAAGLGIAFRDRPVDKPIVDIQQGEGAAAVKTALDATGHFVAEIRPAHVAPAPRSDE